MELGCRIRQVFSWLLLLGAIVLGMLVGLGVLHPPSAAAAIRQLEEAPGQMVYQSRQSLKDQAGNTWQAIAFKRVRPNGQTSFDLRLVGFPGVTALDQTQSLTITTSLGRRLTAMSDASDIFTDTTQPASNVVQYDLQPLLPQLQVGMPLKLALPTTTGATIRLPIPPALIEEWQEVAAHA